MIHPILHTRVERYDNEQSWLDTRKTGIGASEVASIFGVGYKTQSPVTVWASKVGIDQPEIDEETRELFEIGHEMEPFIAGRFEKRTGFKANDPGRFTIFRHPEIEWLFSTLDRYVIHPEHGPIPLELKHVNGRFRNEWKDSDNPALKFDIQCQDQMEVTGTDYCYLAAWIGGDTLSVHLVKRNQRFIDAMIKELRKFWSYVERREMPPVDDSEATRAMLGLIFPKDTGDEISLPENFIELDRELVEVKEKIKTLETRKDGIENKIKAAIGEATRGILPVGSYSWKSQNRNSVDSEKLAQIAPEVYQECLKVSSFRVLRRSAK